MAVPDAISLAESIVGETPQIIRNVGREGWVLGMAALGLTTILSTSSDGTTQGLYLVEFSVPVDSGLLALLDQALTAIEKAGSRHVIKSPIPFWVLGSSALGIDTILGES